ncbi:MAG: histone H1-like repetitive region-containing protein [Thermoguttaceae bacterium]|nr:histone H1-like repetitive region-containing protein [Thermoguttaceae bacterium]
MTNAERAAVLKRMVTVLKKNFKVERPDANRTPIEQLIYSICLENASFTAADDVYNALTHNYFDWNEVRVSSSRELAETMKNLPEPAQTGLRLKRILHYIFDQKYAFEIDEIKKMSVKTFNEYVTKMENVTPFNSAYVMMTVMGRHAIPVSSGEFEVLDILGLIDDKDREKNSVSWLERVIEKKKANEFFSLLHQLAALYVKNPFGRKVMDILTAIVPTCKDRIPKRRKTDEEVQPTLPLVSTPTQPEPKPEPEVKAAPEVKPADKPEEKKSDVEQKPAEQKPAQKQPAEKKPAEKKTAEKKTVEHKTAVKKTAQQKPAEKKAVEKKSPEKKTAEKKPVEKKTAEKKTVENKATVKKTAEKKTVEKKTAEKKTVEKKAAVKKAVEKKTVPAKSTAKSAPAKSAAVKSASAKKTVSSKTGASKSTKSTTAKTTKKSK